MYLLNVHQVVVHLMADILQASSYIYFVAGESISDKDRCPQCKGTKVVQEKKLLEVHVEKGMLHGQKITFQGEADEAVSEAQQKTVGSRGDKENAMITVSACLQPSAIGHRPSAIGHQPSAIVIAIFVNRCEQCTCY